MAEVLVALGTNVGDRFAHLGLAVELLGERMEVVATSRAYRTAPMYLEDQPDFLNAALLARSDLGPLGALRALKEIEREVGRRARQRNGPREIDLDLIAYGAISYVFREGGVETLRVPHPRVAERRFVLQPLADVAPDFLLPGVGKVADLLKGTDDQAGCVHVAGDAVLPLQRHG